MNLNLPISQQSCTRESCHWLTLGMTWLLLACLMHGNLLAARRGNTPSNADASTGKSSAASASTADPAKSPAPQPAASRATPTTSADAISTRPTSTAATPALASDKTDATKTNISVSDAHLSVDAIAAKVKELEAATDADEPDRATLLELYRQALDDLKRADQQKSRSAELEKERIATPYQLQIRKRELAAKPAGQQAAPVALPADAPLTSWEQTLDTAQQDLDAAQKILDEKEKEEQRRAAQRLEIPQAIAAARVKLDELQSASDSAGSSDDSAAVAQARHIAQHAKRLALETEVALSEKELQTFDADATELLSLEREAATNAVNELEKRITAGRDAINQRRETEANQQATEAHWAAATTVPAIRQLADENSALADNRQQLTKAIEQLSKDREAVATRLDKVSDQFKQAADKLSATGLTESIGQMLLKQRSELSLFSADRHAVKQRQDEIARVQLELFDYQEELDDLHNLDISVRELAASLPHSSEAKPADLRRLLETKRKYLQALIQDDNSYFSALVDVDSKQRELLSKADAFRDYIDERVLWIRSTHPLSLTDVGKAASAAAWCVQPANWWSALLELFDGIRSNSLWTLLGVAVFVPWIWAQHRLRAAIVAWSKTASSENTSLGHPFLRRASLTALATFLIAAVWPSLAWFAGWLLVGGTAGHGEFPEALGSALQISAAVLLPLLLVRQICRHDGLGQAHFGWPGHLLIALRRELTRLALFGTPAMLIVTLLQTQSNDVWKDSLGRLAFIAGQLIVAGFVYLTLRPPLGTLHRLMDLRSGTWANRLSLPTFVILLALPVALAGLATDGYYYTAMRLTCRLQTTVWLILGLVTVHALASIWLTGVYRRLALKAASRTVSSSHAAKQYPGLPAASYDRSSSASEAAIAHPNFTFDQEQVDAQTHRLLHNLAVLALAVGLCLVWFDMFPALQFFNQVTLWSDVGVDAARPTPVTLANLLAACVIGVLTVVAAGNLPSLLEISVQRLAPDHGVRYALVAVTRYLIVVLGLAMASSAIGIGWGKLQWLIAAMSFGLGFGLQEIFANFISGLIVLLERPIRIGDTVTVGDVTGTVSRIKMRATTIVDADRKELILPNKDLISGRLVNWTLTDSVIRLVVRVAVAYGSDTEQAQRLLLDVAAKTPEVLRTPQPKAVFMGFGEKSLDFELRVFVGHVDSLLPVRHQLNMAIDRSFHAAGVKLSFAQADTFIRHAESESSTGAPEIKNSSAALSAMYSELPHPAGHAKAA